MAQPDQHTSFLRKIRETGPFLSLLLALLLLNLSGPLLNEFRGASFILDVTYVFVLIAAVYAISNRRTTLWIALALVGPAFASILLRSLLDIYPASAINMVLIAVFLSYVAVAVLREVLRAERVTANEIYGAICGYLLLGSIWVCVYGLILHFNHDAFSFATDKIVTDNVVDMQRDYFSRLTYFSFVTQSTLGYGDIVPRSELARMVAWMQAVAGQFYLAILIARLVAEYIAHRRSSD